MNRCYKNAFQTKAHLPLTERKANTYNTYTYKGLEMTFAFW